MPNTPRKPPKGWLWSDEAADYIGVHRATLYRWRRDEVGPPSSRHGLRAYRYKISELDAWMNRDYADAEHAAAA